MVQTGENVYQAQVFRAHAAPQGLCGNLVDALELLANHQEDGDGFIQNIVTNLCEGSKKGLTEGLREFLQIDVSSCPRSRTPKQRKRHVEVVYQCRPHFKGEVESFTWKMLTGTPSAKHKRIEGEDWRELSDAYKEMSRAVGVQNPQEAQKAEALWKIKAAKDVREEYYDPARKDNILERNKTRLASWEEHLKDPSGRGTG